MSDLTYNRTHILSHAMSFVKKNQKRSAVLVMDRYHYLIAALINRHRAESLLIYIQVVYVSLAPNRKGKQ
jgi:hypothetical protein